MFSITVFQWPSTSLRGEGPPRAAPEEEALGGEVAHYLLHRQDRLQVEPLLLDRQPRNNGVLDPEIGFSISVFCSIFIFNPFSHLLSCASQPSTSFSKGLK
jgi:hypothetical protein